MKNTVSIILLALALVISSCNNTDLNTLAPINSIPADGAINNLKSAQSAVNGAYSILQENDYDSYLVLAQSYTDEADFVGTFPTRLEFQNLNVTTSNTTLDDVFSNFYDAINVANNVIEAIPPIDDPSLDDAAKANLIGQVKFANLT